MSSNTRTLVFQSSRAYCATLLPVAPVANTVFLCMAQMVSELKEQNGLLKTEKDDLNRLIQEQNRQMTGVQTETLKVASSLVSLCLSFIAKSAKTKPTPLLWPLQRKWLKPSCRKHSSWARS